MSAGPACTENRWLHTILGYHDGPTGVGGEEEEKEICRASEERGNSLCRDIVVRGVV
jgi:hypothetical protein